jgi:two-component system, chemotaxis family, protein-glutamate methylesterase/glutaminase
MNGAAAPPAWYDAVVIGASAGGVHALSVVLPALPADGPPVLVVLHVPRDRPSLLVEIFSAKCRAAVREAEDKEPIAAGTIYFAPADYHLLVEVGARLALSADEPENHSRPSIDVLFESAADVYASRLLAVILTGASEDGAEGLAAVQAAGGTIIVQDPATAQAPLMVTAAIDRCRPDRVWSLEQIAARFGALGRAETAR